MTYIVTFFGRKEHVKKWAKLLGVSGEFLDHGSRWRTVLSDSDLIRINRDHWRAKSGTGPLANGMPTRWNDCLSFSKEPAN